MSGGPSRRTGDAGAAPGTAYLVGAGPGDPGLLTLRARELIASAEAILHDRLVAPAILAHARDEALIEYAGKRSAGDSELQETINARLVELALAGRSVVRLKGGDPFVFGRGGEEALALARAGVPFEIVPGVTAGVAAPAYAGIPVTNRDAASAVAFVTGHEDPGKPETAIDWAALAAFPGTLVFYMGVRQLARITEQLVAHGRPAADPAAVIERGTTPRQRTVTGKLDEIAALTAAAGIEPPALTVVGPVAAKRADLSWYERRPLLGRSVAVTRSRAQTSEIARRLTALGADVIEAPAIRTRPLIDDPAVTATLARLADYDLICFTSANGVRYFWGALTAQALDTRALAGVTVAAIGRATATALADHGVSADIVPDRAIAEGLLAALEDRDLSGRHVLIAAAAGGRRTLPDGLTQRGAQVDKLSLYTTEPEPLDDPTKAALAGAHYITFASGSSVRALVTALGGADHIPPNARLISIGPETTRALAALGLTPHAEATTHDIDGLMEAVTADAVGSK